MSPLTIVRAMACIGSSRLCARVERLCQFGHFAQLRRRVSTATCVKSRPAVTRAAGAFLQHCQVRSGRELRFAARQPRSNCPASRRPDGRRDRSAATCPRKRAVSFNFPRFFAISPRDGRRRPNLCPAVPPYRRRPVARSFAYPRFEPTADRSGGSSASSHFLPDATLS